MRAEAGGGRVPLSTMRLADGRRLGYVRWGRAGSRPVLLLHGTPGSRLFRPPDPNLPIELGVDLVTVDRPGYGRSTPRPLRILLDWPNDVAALADHLSWQRFSVVGIGGGGPHALACAVRLPERVAAATLVSSLAPFWPDASRGMRTAVRRQFRLARWAPGLLRARARRAARDPEEWLGRQHDELPECDRQVLARPEVAAVLAQNAAESLPGDEFAREMVLLRRNWRFSPTQVRVPVQLWHGEADRTVPVEHGRRLAAALPDCRATFLPGAGHYLIFDRWAEILSTMPPP